MKRFNIILVILMVLWFAVSGPSPVRAGKGEKEAIEKLTSEVIILQRQVRDMQESIDRNNGQIIALISQISDKVALASHALQDVQTRLQDTQSRVSTALSAIDTRMLTTDSNFRTVNERLAQALDQLSSLSQGLSALKTPSGAGVDLTDPILVFSAAYGDFLKGNYQLAIEQFRQFLARFPQSEQSDDAQYWIGEAYLNQGLNEQAVAEFDLLLANYPTGNKVPAAQLKKGLALLAAGQTDNGIEELRRVIDDYPDSMAAAAAKQRLEDMGVPLTEPTKPARGRRTRRS